MAVARQTPLRNAGPTWGFAFLRTADRWVPRPLFRFGLAVGTGVAFAFMPQQRRYAAEYRRQLLGTEPTVWQLWRQFFAFFFSDQVAAEAFDTTGFDAAVLTANAFGGAHAGLILSHD